MDDLISRQSAIEGLSSVQPGIDKQKLIRTITAGIVATNTNDVYSCGMRNGMRWCKSLLEDEHPKFEDASQYAQPDNKIAKIADLVEGSIDHFGLDDAMDLLYQIKGIIKNG